jgi:hypothetical protein
METTDGYIPFMRQIMDWHRFRQHGYGVTIDPYITIDINTRQPVDVQRLQQAMRTVLVRNTVLRTQFVQGADRLLYQVPLSPSAPLFALRQFSGSLTDGLTVMVRENEAASIDDSVLIKICLCEIPGAWCIRLYVHHLIADPRSLVIIKQELISAYLNEQVPASKPSTEQYIAYKNQRLADRYVPDLAFLRQLLSPVDPDIFTPGSVSAPGSLQTTLRDLCTGSYYHFSRKPGHSFYSALPLPEADRLDNVLRRHRTSLIVLLLMAFARVCQAISSQRHLIGVLYNDGYNPQANQSVGHYMGESFVKINSLAQAGIASVGALQQQLFTLYKHAIFNYNLYGINESVLYPYCVGFVNYAVTPGILPRPGDACYFSPIDTVHFDLDPSFCRYQDYLSLWWRFNRDVYSEAQITAIDALFRSELSQLLQSIVPVKMEAPVIWGR